MSDWIKFSERLPSRADADERREVIARYHPLVPWKRRNERPSALDRSRVIERPCLWNWIPPSAPEAMALWEANGFIEWQSSSAQAAEGGGA